jgi:hypothetical protein
MKYSYFPWLTMLYLFTCGKLECRWELKDCIAVQKLLETSLHDEGAASSKLIMSLIHISSMLNSIMKALHWQFTRLGHHLPSFPIAWHLMFVLAPESCSWWCPECFIPDWLSCLFSLVGRVETALCWHVSLFHILQGCEEFCNHRPTQHPRL